MGKTERSNVMISPGLAPCMASRKVPEPLCSALVTTKGFPIGSVGAGVDGTIVSVGPAVISAGPVAVLAGDGLAPQAFSVRKRIAERKNLVNILLIVFSISSRTVACAAGGRGLNPGFAPVERLKNRAAYPQAEARSAPRGVGWHRRLNTACFLPSQPSLYCCMFFHATVIQKTFLAASALLSIGTSGLVVTLCYCSFPITRWFH